MRLHWSGRIIVRMKKFLKQYEDVLDRRRRRLLPEVFEGVLRSGSLVLVEIARKIKRYGESLEAVEKRLSRQMKSRMWDHRVLQEVLLKQMAKLVKPWTEVVLDLTDLAKLRAKKMEGLDYVYDGSRKETVTGYWLFESYSVISRGKLLPLMCFVYSLRDEGNLSENWVIEKALSRLKEVPKDNGIFVCDRGFDRGEFFKVFEERKNKVYSEVAGRQECVE